MKKVLFSLLMAFVCLPMTFAQVKTAPVFQTIEKSACGSYQWNRTGETYTTDTAVMVIQNDTAFVLLLTMLEPTYDTAVTHNVTGACNATFRDSVFTTAGTFDVAFPTANGCDSIVRLNITLSNQIYDTVTNCGPYTSAWGTAYSASGDYNFDSAGSACTIHYHLNLTVNPKYTDTAAVVAENVTAGCFYTWNGHTYTDTNVTHYAMLTTADGCDSLAAMVITGYTGNNYDTTFARVCNKQYSWQGRTIVNLHGAASEVVPVDTTYTADTVITANGCTNYYHLDLKFVHEYDTLYREGCELVVYSFKSRTGALANDNAYFTVSGFYTADTNGVELYSYKQSTKCHTHHALNVNVVTPSIDLRDTIVADVCDRFAYAINRLDPDSTILTSSALVDHVFSRRDDVDNCVDIVVPLNITIHYSSYRDTTVITCDTFTWDFNGKLYNYSTTVRERVADTVNADGCDSIGRLNLTINKSPEVYIEGNWILEPGETAMLSAVCDMPGVTYAWYRGTATAPVSTTASYTVEPTGDENIDIRLETTKTYGANKCVTKNWITITTNVGIDDIDALQVNLYPNPTSRILNVQSAEGIAEVVIYNAIGQQVMLRKGTGEHMQLDLGSLASGNYSLIITGLNGEQTTRKINVTK